MALSHHRRRHRPAPQEGPTISKRLIAIEGAIRDAHDAVEAEPGASTDLRDVISNLAERARLLKNEAKGARDDEAREAVRALERSARDARDAADRADGLSQATRRRLRDAYEAVHELSAALPAPGERHPAR